MIPKVSILIPCYNSSAWIRQSAESALAQSYANKEVIIADDGSTDGSYDEIEKFGDKIRCVRLKHSGSNVTRNELLRMASGEWIQYLDADDYLLSHKISDQFQCVSRNSGIDVIYSPVILEESTQGLSVRRNIRMPSKNDFYINFIRWGPLQTNGFLFRKDILLEVGGWNENQTVCQEHELLLRLIRQGASFYLHDTPSSVYRRHYRSSISTSNTLATIKARMSITDQLEEYLTCRNMIDVNKRSALDLSRIECARSAYQQDPIYAKSLADRTKLSLSFDLMEPAAPFMYRVALRMLGFMLAERIALILRYASKWVCSTIYNPSPRNIKK